MSAMVTILNVTLSQDFPIIQNGLSEVLCIFS